MNSPGGIDASSFSETWVAASDYNLFFGNLSQKLGNISGPSDSSVVFGTTVSLSSDGHTLVTSSSYTWPGEVYVYTNYDDPYSWKLQNTILAPSNEYGYVMSWGESLEMSGDAQTLAVQGWDYIYIYKLEQSSFSLVEEIALSGSPKVSFSHNGTLISVTAKQQWYCNRTLKCTCVQMEAAQPITTV
ncbi:MAG: hypothetical protein QMC37_04415 [Flavobacteriales bacterium]